MTEGEVPSELSVSTEKSAPAVKVEFDQELTNAPYFIGANPDSFGALLSDLGAPDDFISNTTVRFETRHPQVHDARGRFNSDGGGQNTVYIYTDQLWDKYKAATGAANKLSQGGRTLGNPFKGILHTKRMPMYLKNAPPERALRFAEKLISKGVQKGAINTALHEARHASDFSSGKVPKDRLFKVADMLRIPLAVYNSYVVSTALPSDHFLNVGAALGVGIFTYASGGITPTLYFFDPYERKARSFSKNNRDDPRYKDLIVFGPRPTQGNAGAQSRTWGDVPESNRQPSEPQSDALAN